jgi:hypothetical protein
MVPRGVSPGWITLPNAGAPRPTHWTEEGGGFGLMMDEVALRQLVLDELVGRARVRYAQQRFREHHQREAFLRGQRELAQHVFHAAKRIVIDANRLDQPPRDAIDSRFLRARELRRAEQPCGDRGIVGA